MTKVRTRSNSASASVPVSKQVKIQFQNEGINLGETGTVDVLNFVGTGVDATRSGNTISVSVTGGGAGSSTFIGLTDVPATYAGQALKVARVNAGETALEFAAAGGAITSGSGTTANGTAVDLGGTLSGAVTIAQAGFGTSFTGNGKVSFSGTDAASAGINVGARAADPSSHANGDVWVLTGGALKFRAGGVTPSYALWFRGNNTVANQILYFGDTFGKVIGNTSFTFDGSGLSVPLITTDAITAITSLTVTTPQLIFPTALSNDDALTQILVRDGTGGEIKYRDAASLIVQTITNGVTTSAPSQDAVFDALALKGSGDVVGPASAGADQIAVYNGTTGKLIKDGGVTIAGLQTINTSWLLASGGALTGANTIAQAGFNIGFLNGNVLFGPTGATITANTRHDIRGIGTSTNNALRVANSADAARFTLLDNGVVTFTAVAPQNFNLVSSWNSTITFGRVVSATGTITQRATSADAMNWLYNGVVIVTGATNQTSYLNNNLPTFTTNHTGATAVGYNYDPTLNGSQTPTHLAVRLVSGKLLMGTTITAGSVLADFQSTTEGILLPRVTNIASVATPVNGMLAYDAATDLFNFRQAAAWVTFPKHVRVTTGSVGAGSSALITVTWPVAFADTNYTVVASVLEATTSSLSMSVVHVESKAAGSCTVRVINNAVGALTGEIQAIAIHD